MSAIGDTAATTLIARAAAVGITAEQIATKLRLPSAALWAIANMSGRDWSRIDDMIAAKETHAEESAPAPAAAALATGKQVDFIMSLIAKGRATEGGFFVGPTTRDEVAKMTRTAASRYISSLKGDY